MIKSILSLFYMACMVWSCHAFTPFALPKIGRNSVILGGTVDDYIQETPEAVQTRIKELVDKYPVLLFMKGSKIFPQCGFSNTAVQILNSFGIDFHTVGTWISLCFEGVLLTNLS